MTYTAAMSPKKAIALGLAGMVMGLLALVAVFVVAVAEADLRDDGGSKQRVVLYDLASG